MSWKSTSKKDPRPVQKKKKKILKILWPKVKVFFCMYLKVLEILVKEKSNFLIWILIPKLNRGEHDLFFFKCNILSELFIFKEMFLKKHALFFIFCSYTQNIFWIGVDYFFCNDQYFLFWKRKLQSTFCFRQRKRNLTTGRLK